MITTPIAIKRHVTQRQIQLLSDDGIRIHRSKSDFSPVFAWCKTRADIQRVRQLNDELLEKSELMAFFLKEQAC